MSAENIGGFISAPIKLAALIKRSRESNQMRCNPSPITQKQNLKSTNQLCSIGSLLVLIALFANQFPINSASTNTHLQRENHNSHHEHLSKQHSNEQPRGKSNSLLGSHLQVDSRSLRHHTHYLNIAPSTHFNYNEGRQSQQQSAALTDQQPQARSSDDYQLIEQPNANSQHIYKRSSALISSPGAKPQYQPLVGSMHFQTTTLNQQPALIRRRMMSEGAQGRWLIPDIEREHDQELLAVDASEHHHQQVTQTANLAPVQQLTGPQRQRREHEEAELLRQKQHIQYHDQMPSMGGKCHKRTLNFCASVLPFNTTTFPNIIGDTNRFEVKRSLPFFGFLAKSSCNARLDELLCLLLEPPCSVQTGVAIPPCKKFCRLALEGCNEYIPATLAMSSVFDCSQYPDSNDPSVCINLAQGSKCAPDEFKCPDQTCIPRNWLCDGIKNCLFATDEANCTVPTGVGLQTSVCSKDEFKCDGKCLPKAYLCNRQVDCNDGRDEWSCIYPAPNATTTTTTTHAPTTQPAAMTTTLGEQLDGFATVLYPNVSLSATLGARMAASAASAEQQQQQVVVGTDPPSAAQDDTVSSQFLAGGQMSVVDSSLNGNNPANHYLAESQAQPHHLESNLNEDVSRIIRQESSSASASTAAAMALVAASSQAPEIVVVMEQPQAGSLQQQQSQFSNHQQDESNQQKRASSKELNKFDYDIIQSSQSNLIQLGSDSPPQTGASNVGDQQATQKAQLMTQIDFVPQQQQQQSVRQHRAKGAHRNQYFNQQQPVAANKPMEAQLQQHQRVPIYRSLFKSLKGGQGRFANSANSLAGQSPGRLVGRRRRDRINHQLPQQQVMTTQAAEELAKLIGHHWSSPPTLATENLAPITASSPTPPINFHRPATNYTRAGVASYLQLLNSRYNLRLSRAAATH